MRRPRFCWLRGRRHQFGPAVYVGTWDGDQWHKQCLRCGYVTAADGPDPRQEDA